MGLRISTNAASIAIQNQMSKSQRLTEKAMAELASGTRFGNQGSDSAGHAISESLRSEIKGLSAAKLNAENAVSFIQVAEGALNEQSNILIRLRELAVQAASDTNSDREREYLNTEFSQLKSEIDRIAKSTTFGSNKLLDGTKRNYDFHVGTGKGYENIISYSSDSDTTLSGLSIEGLSVSDRVDARESLESLDEALQKISGARAKFGAIQSRLDIVGSHLSGQIEGMSNAYSTLSDTNVPDAVSRMQRGMVMVQYQSSMLAQANIVPQTTLKLIA